RTVDNVIAGVVITFMDVTQVAVAEAKINELTGQLRDRVDSLEALLDLLPVGVLFLEDSRKGDVRINRYGAHLLGEHGDGNRPRPLTSAPRLFKGETELSADDHPLQRAARGEYVKGFEGHIMLPGGKRTEVLMSATPLLGEDGKVRGAIATFLDLKQRGIE